MATREIRTTNQIEIDIKEPDHDLVNCIRDRIEEISYLHCICKVKSHLLDSNGNKSYIPDQVSIGPYHHRKPSLAITEHLKWQYVHVLFSRKPNLEASLDDCVTALKEVEHRARACYSGEIDNNAWPSNKFLTTLLVDGCFIIELLLRYSIKNLRRRNDKIFTTPGMLFDVRCNLIMLENQIPIFVLQRLFQVVPKPKQCTHAFHELAYRFFRNMLPGDHPQIIREKFNQEAHHVLDILCHCLLPTYPRTLRSKDSQFDNKPLASATELVSAGIRIKRAKTDNLLDIRFNRGVLEIPPILVHQYTEILVKNLIALEQCSAGNDQVQYVTSYAFVVKWLIRSDEDVKLLKKRGVLIEYDEISDDEVKLMFDKLDEVNFGTREFYHDGVRERVNAYKRSRNWRVFYKRHGPTQTNRGWSSLVLVAFLALFVAFVGTLFSILSFFLHFSNKS